MGRAITTSTPISYLSTSSDTSGVLKYRYKHLAKFDINIERNRVVTGVSIKFNSKMENIDKAFIEPLFDVYLGTTSAWNRLNKNCVMVDYQLVTILLKTLDFHSISTTYSILSSRFDLQHYLHLELILFS